MRIRIDISCYIWVNGLIIRKKADVDEVSVFPLLKQTFWDDITTYFTQIYHKISSTFQLMTLFLKNGHNMQHTHN